jgi:hypothetical protein
MKKYTYFVLALTKYISVNASNKAQAVNIIKQNLNLVGDTHLVCIEISRN